MKRLRNLIMFVIFMTNTVSLWGQIDTISTKTLQLKGNIKQVQDYSYSLEPDKEGKKTVDSKKYELIPLTEDWNIERDKTKYSKTNIAYTFDRTGKNMSVTTYFTDRVPFGGMTFKYDKKGKVIGSKTIFTADDGDLVVDKGYFYNEKGQLVKIDENEGGEWLLTTTFKYDDLGNCIEKNKVASLSVLEKDIQEYEEKNLILEKKIRPEYVKEKHYRYNKANKVTHSEELYPNIGVFLRVENEYDKEGYLVKSKFTNEDDQVTICVYKYKKGKLVQSVCTAIDDPDFYMETNLAYASSGGETEVIKTKTETVSKKVFDKNGLLILHRTPDFDHQYKYSFDKFGNWKEVVLYENKVPSKIRTRKIEYY